MLKFHITIPEEPDWYSIYKIYCYKVWLRIKFEDTNDWERTANLEEYYRWAYNNNICMKHTCVRWPGHDGIGKILFMFIDQTHAMAFKLIWK